MPSSHLALRAAPFVLGAALAVSAHADPDLAERRSRHYTLLSDLPDREVPQVLRFLDAMHASYEATFKAEPVREVPRPLVRVYASHDDYLAFGRADEDVAFNGNWRGYYARARNELVSYRGDGLPDLFGILSHEGFHQFAWTYIVPAGADRLPDWYEEGLADYFRTTGLSGGRLAHQFQRHHAERVQRAIREGWVWTQEQLWGCDPALLDDAARFDAFYAHAYLYVRFLIRTERKAVLEVYRLKREGRPSAEVIETVFPPERRARLHEAFLAFARDPS